VLSCVDECHCRLRVCECVFACVYMRECVASVFMCMCPVCVHEDACVLACCSQVVAELRKSLELRRVAIRSAPRVKVAVLPMTREGGSCVDVAAVD
jgi:hypothetical protein